MRFAETMSGQELGTILKSLGEKNATGALEVTTPSVFSTIWLQNGKVIYARSSESIGLREALMSLGLISKETLDKVIQEDAQVSYLHDPLLDATLITKGLASPQIITYIRAFQIAETLFSLVEWDTVGYELKENSNPNVGCPDLLPVHYDWLHDIFEYAADWPRLRNRIGLPQQIFRQKPSKREQQKLNPDEEKLYSLVDSQRRLRELVLWSGLNYFTAHKLLYNLLDMGCIDIVEKEKFRPSIFQSKKVSEKLLPLLKVPGVKNAFLVDRAGKIIVQDRSQREITAETEALARIFVKTVDDFEINLPHDDETGRVEQILVEKTNGLKSLLIISSSVILVIEAEDSVNWGILRLTGQRTLTSVRMQLFAS